MSTVAQAQAGLDAHLVRAFTGSSTVTARAGGVPAAPKVGDAWGVVREWWDAGRQSFDAELYVITSGAAMTTEILDRLCGPQGSDGLRLDPHRLVTVHHERGNFTAVRVVSPLPAFGGAVT